MTYVNRPTWGLEQCPLANTWAHAWPNRAGSKVSLVATPADAPKKAALTDDRSAAVDEDEEVVIKKHQQNQSLMTLSLNSCNSHNFITFHLPPSF